MKENYDIYVLLEEMQKRPAMYVGEVRLKNIFLYLAGYSSAMAEAGVNDHSVPEFYGFREFVRARYRLAGSSMGWVNMILAVTIGLDPNNMDWEYYDQNLSHEQHENSVREFFKLVKDYRGSQTD